MSRGNIYIPYNATAMLCTYDLVTVEYQVHHCRAMLAHCHFGGALQGKVSITMSLPDHYLTIAWFRRFPWWSCWELIISAADYISWRCVSGPGPCIYPVAALILLYHLFMYSESRLFDICLGRSFLFSRTVRVHCSPQFFYRELRWAVLLISILKDSSSLTDSQIIL